MSSHKSREAVVSVDAGGTTVAVVSVDGDGNYVHPPIEIASPSSASSEQIVSVFTDVITAARVQADSYHIGACGISMPAPFDYDRGISHMSHKFQSIQDMPLGEMLAKATGLNIYWLNDGDAFGIGAASWVSDKVPQAQRLIGVTIGTGLGASFVEKGGVVDGNDKRIPPNGEIWDTPYGEGGILEDWVSGPGVAKIYTSLTGSILSAKDVAGLARIGDKNAIAAYETLGRILGTSLVAFSMDFRPDVIVVGGNVSRAFDLFAPSLRKALTKHGSDCSVIQAPNENLAIRGAASYAFTYHEAKATA